MSAIAEANLGRVRCLVVGAGEMARAHITTLRGLGVGAVAATAPSERNRAAVEALGAGFHMAPSPVAAVGAFAPSHAIVATPVEGLAATAAHVIEAGVQEVMVEKPGALTEADRRALAAAAGKAGARVVVGYNRRFYGSVLKAQDLIAKSGEAVTSVMLEFTEWSHVIRTLENQSPQAKARWLLANSMHVIDTAFLPGGLPDERRSHFLATGTLDWHPTAQFVGSGASERGVPFSYAANWDAPGRWGFEWMTPSRRYIFRPLEKLHVTERGTVALNEVALDDDLDQRFKPGLWRQHRAWLTGAGGDRLCTLDHALRLVRLASRMGGYAASGTG